MPVIRGLLLMLSVIQMIVEDSFWTGPFYIFFIWIILFQLLWFYIEKPKAKKITLFYLSLLTIINIIFLPDIPYFMIALLIMDIRLEFNLEISLSLLTALAVIQMVIFYALNNYPSVTEAVLLFGLSALTLWGTNQEVERLKREDERYEFMRVETELKDLSAMLQTKMSGMEEISRITERNRIARDLHDSVGHTISTIVIQLAAIAKLTEQSSPEANKMLKHLHTFAKEGLTKVRQIIHELKPSDYQRLAFTEQLKALIHEFERNSQITVFYNTNPPLWELKEEQQATIYRAVQEFLGNSAKHSHATEIRIQYHFTNTSVILTMQDNGQGTDDFEAQMGLTGMRERAKLIGGKVSIQSASGAGFKVRIVLPKGGFIHDNNRTY